MQDARASAETENGAAQERWLRLVTAIERLSAARSLDDIVEIVRTSAGLIAEADGVTFVLRDGDRCHYVAEQAISPLWTGLRFPMTSCISGWCMLNKRTAVIQDVYADPRIPHDVYRPTFVHSLVMAPIRVEDPLAAIGAYWAEKRAPDPETVKLLETLARSASTAMANTQLFSSLAASEAQAREQLAELEALYRTVPVGLGMFDRDLRAIRVNDAFAAIEGGPGEPKKPTPRNGSPKLGDRLTAICYEALLAGQTVGPAEVSNAKDDTGEARTWLAYASPVATGGAVDRVTISALDISERKRGEEHVRMLLREVNHRSKNLLAVVQAMARLTVTSNRKEAASFSERIRGLAASQDLLVKSEWRGADLRELVRSQLSPFAELIGSRIAIEGRRAVVSAAAAQTLGMVLHELATNAGKYGALSGSAGHVRIEWALQRSNGGGASFVMSWTESGGPVVAEPCSKGFGSTVVSDLVRSNLQGDVDFDLAPAGVKWRLRCAATKVLEEFDASPAETTSGQAAPADQGGTKVLVVEDDGLIALEIAKVLSDAGFEVVGPARSVMPALALIEKQGCDAAVLDVNLGDETSEAIAKKLKAVRTPFITLSGYSRSQHPPVFAGSPALAKPLRSELLVAELKRCIS